MAKLRVLAEAPPPARGFVENQIREMREYLTRMKDELEFLLTHLGEDNLNRDLAELIDGKQDAEQVADAVARAIKADDSLMRLHSTATDVSTDTTLNLDASSADYSLLMIYGYAGGTAAGNRFSVVVQRNALSNTVWVPVAANGTVGAMRIGLSNSDWSKIRVVSQTFSSMRIDSILGRR